MERAFENVAIAHFFPQVAKEDFKHLARALRLHLLTDCNVGNLDNQPCPFGDAFVGFNSQLERRRFLDGPPLSVDDYAVRFVKHDEGDNARELDTDREVWLMLLGCPLDAISTSTIAKSVSGFAQLKHVHESAVMSRIVIKVSMHDEKLVPPSVMVGVGDGVKIRTSTVPIYILSATNVTTLGDEDGYPLEGPRDRRIRFLLRLPLGKALAETALMWVNQGWMTMPPQLLCSRIFLVSGKT
jgi:hypothetical protein